MPFPIANMLESNLSTSMMKRKEALSCDKNKSREEMKAEFSKWSQQALDEIQRLERQCRANEAELKKKDNLIAGLSVDTGELKRLRLENNELVKERDDWRRRAETLSDQLREAMEKLKTAADELDRAYEIIRQLKEEMKRMNAEYETEIERLKSLIRDLEAKIRVLQIELNKFKELPGIIEDLRRQSVEANRKNAELEGKTRQAMDKYKDATRQVETMKVNITRIERRETQAKKRDDGKLKNENAELKRRISGSEAENAKLLLIIEELRNRNVQLVAELSRLQKDLASALEDLRRMKCALEMAEGQIEKLNLERQDVLQYLRRIQSEVTLIEQESAYMKSENKKLKALTYDAIVSELRSGNVEEYREVNYNSEKLNGFDVEQLHSAKRKLDKIMATVKADVNSF